MYIKEWLLLVGFDEEIWSINLMCNDDWKIDHSCWSKRCFPKEGQHLKKASHCNFIDKTYFWNLKKAEQYFLWMKYFNRPRKSEPKAKDFEAGEGGLLLFDTKEQLVLKRIVTKPFYVSLKHSSCLPFGPKTREANQINASCNCVSASQVFSWLNKNRLVLRRVHEPNQECRIVKKTK